MSHSVSYLDAQELVKAPLSVETVGPAPRGQQGVQKQQVSL